MPVLRVCWCTVYIGEYLNYNQHFFLHKRQHFLLLNQSMSYVKRKHTFPYSFLLAITAPNFLTQSTTSERQNEHVKGIYQSLNDLLHIWLFKSTSLQHMQTIINLDVMQDNGAVSQSGWETRACHSAVCVHMSMCLHVSERVCVCVCVSSSCFELEWTWHSDLSWSKCTLHNSCSEITHQNHHHWAQLLSNQPALSVHPVVPAKVENTHMHFPFSRYIKYKSQFAYSCRSLIAYKSSQAYCT